MIFVFCYIPCLQAVAYSAPIPAEYWGFGFLWGACLLGIDEVRKCLVRRGVRRGGERGSEKGEGLGGEGGEQGDGKRKTSFWVRVAW